MLNNEPYEAFVRCTVCDRRAVVSFMGKRVCLHYGAFGMHHVDNACMDECEFPEGDEPMVQLPHLGKKSIDEFSPELQERLGLDTT